LARDRPTGKATAASTWVDLFHLTAERTFFCNA
jgi:hypothetical protein